MKGVILAGGKGTRLYPCTLVTNKHLLPIYDQPMVYYPIETLAQAGCDEILIVTGGKNPGEFMCLLGDGSQFGLKSIMYVYQQNPVGGIADALRLARPFIGRDEKFCVVLGDNLIFDNLKPYVSEFVREPRGTAKVFIKEIENPTSFGVAEISDGRVTNLLEKPKNPPTNYAVIGIYMYDSTVFDMIRNIEPSARGELEITDVNREYMKRGSLTYAILDSEWLDTGTFQSLAEAQHIVMEKRKKRNPT